MPEMDELDEGMRAPVRAAARIATAAVRAHTGRRDAQQVIFPAPVPDAPPPRTWDEDRSARLDDYAAQLANSERDLLDGLTVSDLSHSKAPADLIRNAPGPGKAHGKTPAAVQAREKDGPGR